MPVDTTIFWLKFACVILFAFGVMVAAAALPSAMWPVRLFADLAYWPLDGAQPLSAPEFRLFCAVSGGMLAGWSVLLWLVTTRLLPREPEMARTMILASIGIWFLVDSAGSVLAGAPMNALFNVGFLVLFVVPLWRPVQMAHG